MSKNIEQKNLPDGWKQETLGKLFDITSSKRVFESDWTSSGVPFYRTREIVQLAVGGNLQNEIYISKEMYASYKQQYGVPKKGDLLVSGVGTIGVAYLVKNDSEFYFKDGNIIWLKGKGIASPEFVEQLFRSYAMKKKILGTSPITTVATYTIDTAKKTSINLPPLPEQNRIVKVLETWDRAIEILTKKIEHKKEIKRGLMQNLLTGKIRLPGFYGEWKSIRLEKLSKIYDGTHQTPEYVEKGVPFYSVEHITSKNFQDTKFIAKDVYLAESKRVKIQKGDILMSRIGDIGTARYIDWEVEASFYVTLALIKCNENVDAKFLSHLINSHEFKREIWSKTIHVAFPNKINLGDIGKCESQFPSISEQKAIALVLDAAENEIESLEQKFALLKDQKKYLLNNLVTGIIRTPENI